MIHPASEMIPTWRQTQRAGCAAARCATALLVLLAPSPAVFAATVDFGLNFAANQSLWQGGPNGGFDRSGQFGSSAGIRYSARANSGTVAASVNGQLRVQHPDTLDATQSATIDIAFLGDSNGGSIHSSFGASVNVSGFIPCLVSNPFTGNCLHPRSFDLLNEGFFLNPSRNFSPTIDVRTSASDIDNALGVGPNLNLIVGELGAEVNVDVRQSISFTPTGLTGMVRYSHRTNGASGMLPFSIPTAAGIQLNTTALTAGLWDFEILSLDLQNSFRNDVDLDLRPTINYVIGQWPAPGNPLFRVGLLDETFALNFNTLPVVGSFTIEVDFATDFNGDGLSNLDDINLMLAQGPVAGGVPVTPTGNSQFDLTGDGVIDNDDVNAWLSAAATDNGLDSPYQRGDADLDGVVDGRDFNLWNAHKFSSSLSWDRGDFSGDGIVDGVDFGLWNTAKFTSSTAAAVPEPMAWSWMVWVGLCLPRRRRMCCADSLRGP